jgi:LuxR family transcriptional regulator, maltose regulon positive regulatory protein
MTLVHPVRMKADLLVYALTRRESQACWPRLKGWDGMHQADHALNLVSANLTVPPAPAYAVLRPRLLRHLDAAVAKGLTILEAPAGCGKTTLLSSWAPAQGRPVGWLTAEPGALWPYMSAALAGESAGEFKDMVNRVSHAGEPVTLIVDDAQQIDDPVVYERLDYLLRHATGNLRLILSTRAEPPMPLHRWRVRDELTVIGAAELAFTEDETAEVLGRMQIVLPDRDLAELHRRTEGWAAGVCLSALAFKDNPAVTDRRMNGFLLAEILGGQPEETRDALLDASILDRVHSDLLDALTDRQDGRRMLDDLSRRGVFISPLNQNGWYRLHPLFGEALREELRSAHPDRIPALHSRASAWLADHELAVDALRHALATPHRDLAAEVVNRHWPDLLPYGHRRPPVAEAPGTASAARTDPVLALAYAVERLNRHDCDGAEPYLRLAEDSSLHDVFRLAQTQLRGDVTAMALTAERILRGDETGMPADDATAAAALTARGTAELLAGRLSAAETTFREGHTRAVGAGLSCPAALCLSRLAYTQAELGDLAGAEQAAQAALNAALCPGQTEPVHSGHAHLALAVASLHRDRLDDALSLVEKAEALFDTESDPALAPTIGLVRAEILTEAGRWADGLKAVLSARQGGVHPSHLEHQLIAAEADIFTARGEPGAARTLLDSAGRREDPALSVAYAEACLRERDPRSAVAAVEKLADADLTVSVRVRRALVESRAAWQRGDSPAAALERALAEAEPAAIKRTFLGVSAPEREMLLGHLDSGTAHRSFLDDLLKPDPQAPAPEPVRGLVEPLTEREMTVLRYLQSILSNVEVASEMCLSVNTVKTHVRNIYRKLGATHRRDAVRRARELQLL